MPQLIMNGVVVAESEDSGMALIGEVVEPNPTDDENGVYVRIISWDNTKRHSVLTPLIGKEVKVTVEW